MRHRDRRADSGRRGGRRGRGEGRRDQPGRQAASSRVRAARDLGAGSVHRGVGSEQAQRLGVQPSSTIGPDSSSSSRASAASAARLRDQRRQRRHALAQVGARCLAESVVSLATSMMSSESWKAVPICSPNSVRRARSPDGAGDARAEARRRGDQRAGLVGHDREVVRERVVAVARADRLADLPLDQPRERLRLDAHRRRARGRPRCRTPGRTGSRRSGSRPSCPTARWRSGAPRRRSASSITSSW